MEGKSHCTSGEVSDITLPPRVRLLKALCASVPLCHTDALALEVCLGSHVKSKQTNTHTHTQAHTQAQIYTKIPLCTLKTNHPPPPHTQTHSKDKQTHSHTHRAETDRQLTVIL